MLIKHGHLRQVRLEIITELVQGETVTSGLQKLLKRWQGWGKNSWLGVIVSSTVTCDVDSLLELVLLTLLEWSVDDVCRRYSTSLKTFLSPPPGLCLMLAREPTLLSTLSSIFWSTICEGWTREKIRNTWVGKWHKKWETKESLSRESGMFELNQPSATYWGIVEIRKHWRGKHHTWLTHKIDWFGSSFCEQGT